MELPRSSGLLLHITSLPSPYGIGDIGSEAHNFLQFLKDSGHTYWQLLPVNPTDEKFNFSPYSSYSAFAGNPLLISPQLLENDGFIDLKVFPLPKKISAEKAHFKEAQKYKEALLDAAFDMFQKEKKWNSAFFEFVKKHKDWLEDFSLFLALRKKFDNSDWTNWPSELKNREPKALRNSKKELSLEVRKGKFIQFLFFSQWEILAEAAHKKNIKLFGDIPFYVNHDSADCWANSKYFKLNKEKQPVKVSGVPPDYFSETGQLWGTPVYDWKKLKSNNFDWWVKRIKQNLLLFDLVRLDHFRAFSAAWEVKSGEETAMNGKWVKTPGNAFFDFIKKEYPKMPFIAEDLGSLDEPVFKLMKKYDFPGMKVLLFAFGEGMAENPYIPFNHRPRNVVYTGTHDNNTSRGWFENAGKMEKENLKEYSGMKVTAQNVHEVLHKMALKSVAALAIIPVQDLLGLGKEAVMNIPGTTENNWNWRLKSLEPLLEKAEQLKEWNEFFGRK